VPSGYVVSPLLFPFSMSSVEVPFWFCRCMLALDRADRRCRRGEVDTSSDRRRNPIPLLKGRAGLNGCDSGIVLFGGSNMYKVIRIWTRD